MSSIAVTLCVSLMVEDKQESSWLACPLKVSFTKLANYLFFELGYEKKIDDKLTEL